MVLAFTSKECLERNNFDLSLCQKSSWCNKKNEGGISKSQVNPVSYITNPNSHTPFKEEEHILSKDASLSSLNWMIDPHRPLITWY
jgi:hypothetical protein